MRFAGELSALATALCWATGFNLFAAAGQRFGSQVLNRLRLSVAVILYAVTLAILRGAIWPTWASPAAIGYLALSGVIGFVFADGNTFRALVILGPSRGGLLSSLAPVFTVVLAWPILGEHPGPLALLGMALTLGGVVWVLIERERRDRDHAEGSAAAGIAAGVMGAVGQAAGFVFSKLALRTGIDTLSASFVRVVAATAAIWLLTALRGEAPRTVAALRDRRASGFMLGGAVLGPYLGVLLSLLAIQYIQTGVASSIIAFAPVFTILIASRFHREKLTLRMLAGALVAVAGVVVLFLR